MRGSRRRTHCPHGHTYNEENTIWITQKGGLVQRCRTCLNKRRQACRAKRSAELQESRLAYKKARTYERFENFYEIDEAGCWIWGGVLDKDGYGDWFSMVYILGKDHNKGRAKAHVAAWILFVGEVPEGLCVCHKCDVRSCVNPEHLWVGTSQENTKDRSKKGRSREQQATHCRRGHPFDEVNTYIVPGKGGRRCRQCVSDRQRRTKAERRQSSA